MRSLDARPDGSLTPINYLDGKTAVGWAFLLASQGDLRQAREDLGRVDGEYTAEHHAILEAAHFRRFGRFLAHV